LHTKAFPYNNLKIETPLEKTIKNQDERIAQIKNPPLGRA
tara:strand:- start:1013 stop:1132 length:120 start_codon:yes stop_codon:yes gene_type:complete